jgi:hypothetical protein
MRSNDGAPLGWACPPILELGMKILIRFFVAVLVLAGCGLARAADHSPCALHPTQPGWRVFVDHPDRFCFEYPAKYRSAPARFAPGVSTGASLFMGRLTTKPTPAAGVSAQEPEVASIDVFAYGVPFQPEALTRFAPTGMEDHSPQHIPAAHGDFYYYGPGGGGVEYPDDFYFGIRGRTFSISFSGPYSTDKTPDPETKRIEPEVLASFRSF